MSSSNMVPEADRPRAVDTDSTQPPETFLQHMLEAHFDKLYDLPENIQDVMGLQALQPSAVVCKVMTVPNSHCVRIVTPDEHVSTGFHEILVNDMGQQDWPQVNLSDIGCLRLDWPKDLFVGRYQCELEQMRKVCRDRFGPTASGSCPTCDKYIKVNLGKHVALYHLDLANTANMLLSGDRTCLDYSTSCKKQMPSQYVVVTDAGQRKSPQVCRKGPPRTRRVRPLPVRHDGWFSVPRLLE